LILAATTAGVCDVACEYAVADTYAIGVTNARIVMMPQRVIPRMDSPKYLFGMFIGRLLQSFPEPFRTLYCIPGHSN
jgi:hypothetical protein